ncbi:glycosyltransferase [Sporolactobacillus pectinivorans]|uniref:glycosyltransferase n=1 Tax=Sporolactobacillus pectinivorans TaxID=1591408 RepID=UPI000C25DB1B|nr:glycosyltransferase [Sporolactobacillus pectinivorans]
MQMIAKATAPRGRRFITIAYYISDYGYGHAARSVAIIRRLCREKNLDIKIIICHSFAYEFLNESLYDLISKDQVVMRRLTNDIGYVLKPYDLHPDADGLKIKYEQFVRGFSESARKETLFLKKNHVDLVISDIPPVPFTAARAASVPSIGISNFTWYTAYSGLLTEEERQPLLDSYQDMDYFFALAGSRERLWGRKGNESFGFFSRNIQLEEVKRIKRLVDPEAVKTIVFFGLGMKIEADNLASLKLWRSKDCVFLVSSNMAVIGENIHPIPGQDTESQNYIAASDIVISKPGWGTVAEAVSLHKQLILVTRDQMREDNDTVAYLRHPGRCVLVRWEDFHEFQITEEIHQEMGGQEKNRGEDSEDVVDHIAERICSIIGGD